MTELINTGSKIVASGDSADRRVFRTDSSWYTLESELREAVAEKGCQQRGTEEICRACAQLALEVPMCRQLRQNGTIETNE